MTERKALAVVGGLLCLAASSGYAGSPSEIGASATLSSLDVASGELSIQFDTNLFSELGWDVYESSDVDERQGDYWITFPLSTSSVIVEGASKTGAALRGGSLATTGGLLVASSSNRLALGDLTLSDDGRGNWSLVSATDGVAVLHIDTLVSEYGADTNRIQLTGELTLSQLAAALLGRDDLEQIRVGWIKVDAISGDPIVDPLGSTRGDNLCDEPGDSPDVIVGDLPGISNYGQSGGIAAYAVGTTSCNIGTCWLNWISSTNDHPVIAQNLYRIKDGRFEQIGQSWLKHGFFALSGSLCFNDCQSTNGDHLGVHCSDPYSSGLNGSQGNLGPRSEVNAFTGQFPYPFGGAAPAPTIGRRLQVEVDDVDPALNSGALYFVEGQYIARDDAEAGNGGNNASYRRAVVNGSLQMSVVDETVREKPAIHAWATVDPSVRLRNIKIPGEGSLTIGAKVIDLGTGEYRYEYALHNLNSDRAVSALSIPKGSQVVITDPGFSAPHSHSGEPYSNDPWVFSQTSDEIRWETQTFAQNPDANAIRWGTTYSFWFTANVPPVDTSVAHFEVFKDPATVPIAGFRGPATDAPPPVACGIVGDRCLTICAAGSGSTQALRLRYVDNPNVVKWVDAPDETGYSRLVCDPVFRDWGSGGILIADRDIIPAASYEIQAIHDGDDTANEDFYSEPLVVDTNPIWGDAVGEFDGATWSGPNGFVNFNDINACVSAFQTNLTAPPSAIMDLHGEVPNGIINFVDISHFVFAFQDLGYPFGDPAPCP